MQNVVKLDPLIKPYMILGVTLFWFMMCKSSSVPSCTQGLFSTCCRWYCVSWLLQALLLSSCGGVRPWARSFYIICSGCFCWTWSWNCHVSKPCVLWFLNYIASATKFEPWVVITLFILRCMLNYLRTLCNICYVCWIMYDLGCMLVMFWGPSRHSMDNRIYMGSSMTARPLQWLTLYLCSYKLVGYATMGIGARFNTICHMCN